MRLRVASVMKIEENSARIGSAKKNSVAGEYKSARGSSVDSLEEKERIKMEKRAF